MKSGLEVIAHPTGPWLVRAGAVVYAVPAELGRPLARWHGCRPSAGELAAQSAPPGIDRQQWAAFMISLNQAISGTGGSKDPFKYIPNPLEFRRKVQEEVEKTNPEQPNNN